MSLRVTDLHLHLGKLQVVGHLLNVIQHALCPGEQLLLEPLLLQKQLSPSATVRCQQLDAALGKCARIASDYIQLGHEEVKTQGNDR